MFAAARGGGTTCNGAPARVSDGRRLARRGRAREPLRGQARRVGSRSAAACASKLTGSVAYKLARIAAGHGDATFTLTPKNEWDICVVRLLVECAGGRVTDLAGQPLRFNRPNPMLTGLIASNGLLHEPLLELVRR